MSDTSSRTSQIYLVSDYMSDGVFCANLRDGLRQTHRRMIAHGIRHMPVVDAQEKVVGIISDRDLRRPDIVDVGPGDPEAFVLDDSMAVEAVMSGHPDCVQPEEPIDRAVSLILHRKRGALPVVNAQGKAVGMISAWDLLRFLRDLRGCTSDGGSGS